MRVKARPPGTANAPPPTTGASVKLSVNVSEAIGQRLRRVAFEERLSESSIVEVALDLLFGRTTDANVGRYLRERGASLRRGLK